MRITSNFSVVVSLILALPSMLNGAPPDLTAPGVMTTIKRNHTYNLGSTGLRGWIYEDLSGKDGFSKDTASLHTDESRQILVTLASTPGSAVLAVDDVILGAMAGGSGTVPAFTSDARKTMGAAIGDAEKTGAGTLRVKRWRAGTLTEVNIPMSIMGDYAATAPYHCPKSAKILAEARIQLVRELAADPKFLTVNYSGAINGLALLAGVAPSDPEYATVQARLQTFARDCASSVRSSSLPTWHLGYLGLLLSEYYLSTGDAAVVTGINNYTVTLAQMQGKYGTYGHGGSSLKADGSLHGGVPAYGTVHQCSIIANMAIVMGKKALLAAGQALDPEIDPAIERGAQHYSWYVNKGGMPYGENEPNFNNHASNGKDPACAVLFGIQSNRTVETEFFSRLAIAGCNGRESGHAGHAFSYLWGALGANRGGERAVAEYLKEIRWQHDLLRRTDGSFVYDSDGKGTTADGTYLGMSRGYDFSSTGSYVLTYALPLKRLYITGKEFNPAHTLDATKVANAIAAATFRLDCQGLTNTQLIESLKEFDPIVRKTAAIELSKRTLTPSELTTLRDMISGADANGRMAACETLGILKDTTALPLIVQRLDKATEKNSWVRTMASKALQHYDPNAVRTYLAQFLTAIRANAIDPDVMNGDDPIQFTNNYLANMLFYEGNLKTHVMETPRGLLLPALQTELKNPDGAPRGAAASFCFSFLELPEVMALLPDIIENAQVFCDANTMSSLWPRAFAIQTLAKWKIREGIPVAVAMLEPPHGWKSDIYLDAACQALVSYGDAARWTLPTLKSYLIPGAPNTVLKSTIESIENAVSSPTLLSGSAVATHQVVAIKGTTAITLTGSSCRDASVTFLNISIPAHGKLTGTPPNLKYTPHAGYAGMDSFTFQTRDQLTTSAPATVSLIVGGPGTGSGLKGEYFDHANFANLKLTRTDAQVDFDWGIQSPDASLGAGTFSVRWSGTLLVPETGSYTFATLYSDAVRLSVNGELVMDEFANNATRWKDTNPIHLTAGQMVDLCMEYSESTGPAVAKLKWTGPSFAGPNGAIIGKQWLFEGKGFKRAPHAHAQTVPVMQNTSQKLTLQGRGVISKPLTCKILTQPAHGKLSGTAATPTYTPQANFTGTDSFTFLVNNGFGNSAPETVTLVVATATDGNDSPVAFSQKVTASSNKTTTITLDGLDVEDSALTYTLVTPPAHGALSGTPPRVIYTPAFNYEGSDSFTFKVNDGALDSAPVTIPITVSAGVIATLISEVPNGSPHTGPLIKAMTGDLLETSLSSVTESSNSTKQKIPSHKLQTVHDGQIIPIWGASGMWGSVTPGQDYIEFHLNTAAAPLGYPISSIKVIQGGDGFRPQQAWKVSFQYAGSNTFTDFLTLPLTGVPKQLNQVVLANATGGLLANRVTAIRFDFGDSGENHGWTCYSEIDVTGAPATPPGIPLPSTLKSKLQPVAK